MNKTIAVADAEAKPSALAAAEASIAAAEAEVQAHLAAAPTTALLAAEELAGDPVADLKRDLAPKLAVLDAKNVEAIEALKVQAMQAAQQQVGSNAHR